MSQNEPLTQAELDRFAEFLHACGPGAMNLEAVDGFLTALISGPNVVMPSEYLPEIWGDPTFESMEQAQAMMGLVMRHWNTIADEMLRTVKKFDIRSPLFLANADGAPLGTHWARGFMRGVELRTLGWDSLIEGKDTTNLIVPIMLIANKDHPDPAEHTPSIPADKREEGLALMLSAVTHIYRFFEKQRRPKPATSSRSAPPKVGRNEPCPCGSGRKYKHCHGSGSLPTRLH